MPLPYSAQTSQIFLPTKGQPLPCLVVLASPEADEHGLQFILLAQPLQKVIAGRDPECAIALQDPSISRRHISLEITQASSDPVIRLSRLGTTESTILIGNQPLNPKAEGVLRLGDTLRLGNTELKYVLFKSSTSPSSTSSWRPCPG